MKASLFPDAQAGAASPSSTLPRSSLLGESGARASAFAASAVFRPKGPGAAAVFSPQLLPDTPTGEPRASPRFSAARFTAPKTSSFVSTPLVSTPAKTTESVAVSAPAPVGPAPSLVPQGVRCATSHFSFNR
jgi:hypothetical protein